MYRVINLMDKSYIVLINILFDEIIKSHIYQKTIKSVMLILFFKTISIFISTHEPLSLLLLLLVCQDFPNDNTKSKSKI